MPAAAPQTPPQLDFVSLGGNFLLVLALLVAVLWLLRRMQGFKGLDGLQGLTSLQALRPSARRLAVLESLSVGPRQRIALVRVDDREVLIGLSPAGFTLLQSPRPEPMASSPESSEAVTHAAGGRS